MRLRAALLFAVTAVVALLFPGVSNGSGGPFTPAPGSPFDAGGGAYSHPWSVAISDLNGDGKPDLATANNLSNNVSVLLGNGSGGFSPAPGSPFTVGGVQPLSVAIDDLNGDGKPDLATANAYSGTASVLLGNGSGGFSPAAGSPFSVGAQPRSVAISDLNSDGKPDLTTANYNYGHSSNVTVLLGNGSGDFSPAVGSPFAAGSGPISVAIGDLNGDGKADLATANYASSNVSVLLGNGSGGFSAAAGSPFSVGTGPDSLAIGDLNSDGMPDLATANYDGKNVSVLLGNGSGGFSAAVDSPFAAGWFQESVAIGDLNGDGKADLATGRPGSYNINIWLGIGDGGFSTALFVSAGSRGPHSVAIGDLNGDGKPDLATANTDWTNPDSNNVSVLLGNGFGGGDRGVFGGGDRGGGGGAGDGSEDGGGDTPILGLSVLGQKVVQEPGAIAKETIVLRNRGNTKAVGAQVCLKKTQQIKKAIVSKFLKPEKRCHTIGTIAAGSSTKNTLKFKVKPTAQAGKLRVVFVATANGVAPVQAVKKLRVASAH